ncbi:hypothetical protein M231_01179 [Tremella mesenterica]|uniref:Uncharacterized protein n=1 Tax=Tremella mesenterica TaxID=5217 RepID=A0A4Q1BTR2_TREME|nr:hypothetical protein M231_01179 [Tremella mesenterica]
MNPPPASSLVGSSTPVPLLASGNAGALATASSLGFSRDSSPEIRKLVKAVDALARRNMDGLAVLTCGIVPLVMSQLFPQKTSLCATTDVITVLAMTPFAAPAVAAHSVFSSLFARLNGSERRFVLDQQWRLRPRHHHKSDLEFGPMGRGSEKSEDQPLPMSHDGLSFGSSYTLGLVASIAYVSLLRMLAAALDQSQVQINDVDKSKSVTQAYSPDVSLDLASIERYTALSVFTLWLGLHYSSSIKNLNTGAGLALLGSSLATLKVHVVSFKSRSLATVTNPQAQVVRSNNTEQQRSPGCRKNE